MLEREIIENKLNSKISDDLYYQIQNLEYKSLDRIRTNLEGKQFSHLLVLGRAPSDISKTTGITTTRWWCLCDCEKHNIIAVRVNNLTSGNTTSCGCWKKKQSLKNIEKCIGYNKSELTGQKFGLLTALEPTEMRKNGSVIWKCKCSCENHTIVYVQAKELKRGGVKSCGCLKESYGSYRIKEILQEMKENFITEIEFKTCVFPDSKAPARFDFYLPDRNIIIEFDGIQHFKEQDLNYFKDNLRQRQYHDNYKNKWCIENNISLYRIPYTDVQNINKNNLLSNKYLVKEI